MPGLSSKSVAQIKQRANSAIRSADAILAQSKNTYKQKSSKLSNLKSKLKGRNPFKSMKKKLKKTKGGKRKTMKKRKTTKKRKTMKKQKTI
jgi:hypothetical protein